MTTSLDCTGRKIPKKYENPFDNVIIDIAEALNTQLFKLGFITPNMITTMSLLIGISAVYAFTKQYFFLSASLFILAYLMDCMDGNYARKYNMVTKFGDYYDHVADVIKIIFMTYVVVTSMHVTHHEKILFISTTIILFLACQVQLGCQERIYGQQQSHTLAYMQYFCGGTRSNPESLIMYTKWLGCGTLMLFITFFICYIGIKKENRLKTYFI